MANYRICTKCVIHHYENCGTCFGFGVYAKATEDGLIPVNAHAAHAQEFRGETIPCPECGSTPEGLPQGDIMGRVVAVYQSALECIACNPYLDPEANAELAKETLDKAASILGENDDA